MACKSMFIESYQDNYQIQYEELVLIWYEMSEACQTLNT